MVELVPEVFVARELELGVLERAAVGSRDDGGSALVVAGEAGVGKSRLLREASERARGAGMLVLRGRAASGAGQAPFRAVAEALAGGLRARAVPETSLRSFAPALAHVLPGWFERTSDAAPELVFLAEAVLRLLRLLAGARGVLLGLEDLQWADPESLALVEYLAENVGTERLLLVGTVRDDEPSAPLLSLRELARRGAMRWLELGRLDQDEVVKLAAARLGHPRGAVPSSVSALLQARAEGLPLFVEELLGGLIAGDALRRAGCTPAAGLVPRTAAAPEATAARSAHTPLSRARTSFPAPAPPPSPAPHPAGTPAPAPSSGAQHPHIMINHRDLGCLSSARSMPITAPSRGSISRSRSRRAFRRRSPRVVPLPLLIERPPRCVWDTKPVLPHQEDVPVSTAPPQDNRP